MVTGDHGVAAVAVARECGLVEPGYRVFLGDVAGGDTGGKGGGGHVGPADVEWRDVDEPSAQLDPATLLPADGSAGSPYRLALTGRAFAVLLAHHRSGVSASAAGAGFVDSDFLPRLLLNCAVLSRMSPDQKAQLVEELQATGLYVLMIGDGANDALALRAAHVGISLSQVEASVAAPFTYAVDNPSIEAVPMLLLEGRGALTTSFNLFLFMAL
jgi:cation-transporting P-type ATPase 13A2